MPTVPQPFILLFLSYRVKVLSKTTFEAAPNPLPVPEEVGMVLVPLSPEAAVARPVGGQALSKHFVNRGIRHYKLYKLLSRSMFF